jgi:hypothetical protein
MHAWSTSLQSALRDRRGQFLLALAFIVPAIATAGQYWSTRFWSESAPFTLLFWPGQAWHWGLRLPVWISMGAMLASYLIGIAWLVRRRTFAAAVLASVAAMIVANLAGAGVNLLTGWREMQTISSMNLAGRANLAIFSLWHNPAWEEVVFRGLPLVALVAIERTTGRTPRWVLAGYYLVPSLAMAWYHVPGHGPSRLVDTFTLSLVFAWMARRYTFLAPLVMHYVFDAVMIPSLGSVPSIPAAEVAWIANHAGALNSAWSLALLLWIASVPLLVVWHRRRGKRKAVAAASDYATIAGPART